MTMDTLLPYFERELQALRKDAQAFAAEFPEIAHSLGLASEHCDDPHIERLLEGVAYLAARTQHRVDCALPELAQAMLTHRHPDWLHAIPSSTIVQIQPGAEQLAQGRLSILPEGTLLTRSQLTNGSIFLQTCWDIQLHGLDLITVELQSVAGSHDWAQRSPDARYVLKIKLANRATSHVMPAQVSLWLSTDPGSAWAWWDLLHLHSDTVWTQIDQQWTHTDRRISAAGIGTDRSLSLWPRDLRTPSWHSALQDYFILPEAARFLELPLLPLGCRDRLTTVSHTAGMTVWIPLNHLAGSEHIEHLKQGLGSQPFKLNCVAASNWKKAGALPIRPSDDQADFRLRPDNSGDKSLGIMRVESVHYTCQTDQTLMHQALAPLLSLDMFQPAQADQTLPGWYAYEDSPAGHAEPDWRLALMNRQQIPQSIQAESIGAALICHQHQEVSHAWMQDTPDTSRWRLKHDSYELSAHIVCKPSPFIAAVPQQECVWHLMALSGTELMQWVSQRGELLKSWLRLFNRGEDAGHERRINSIKDIRLESTWVPLPGKPYNVWVSANEVTLYIHGKEFASHSVVVWSRMLDRLLGGACPLQQVIRLQVFDIHRDATVYVGPWRTSAWDTLPEELP